MELRWASDVEDFCRDPLGRLAKVGPFSLWCIDASLTGLSLPPSADLAQIEALFTVSKRSPLPGMQTPYDVIIDERQLVSLSSVAVALFLGFIDSLGELLPKYLRSVRIVSPRDPLMAMVASGFGVLSKVVPGYRVVDSLRAAFLELGRDPELTTLLGDRLARTGAPDLAEFERLIAADLQQARLAPIARALGKSERTLQRLLQESGTSFGELVDRARQEQAVARLQAGDKIEQIARDLGFSSASSFSTFFRRRVGMSPGEYRRGGRAPMSRSED